MKKIMNWMLAAILICGASVFTSCSSNDDNPTPSEPEGEMFPLPVEPTTDQLEVKVTADMPTAVLSQFDENSVGAALVKRLSQTTNAIGDDTKLVLLDDSKARTLSEDDFYPLALIYLNGGYIALQRPTLGVALAVALGLEGKAAEIQNDILKKNGVEMSEEAAASRSSILDGELVRKVNNACALTRGEDDDPNAVIDELLIMSINASYLIPPYNEEETISSQAEDENGQETTVEHKVENILNAYHYGRLADGAASWLNTKEQEKAEAQQPVAANARTRAEANDVINSMMSCTDEITITGSLDTYDNQGRRYNRKNASNTTIRSWSIHDFATNRDYYYVEESHHIRMGGENQDKSKTLYWGPYDKEKWMYTWEEKPSWFGVGLVALPKTFSIEGWESYGSDYAYYYGSWLSQSDHIMELTGEGEINVEKSLPSTDNNQSTETIAIGTTDGTSHTEGWSFGGSLGANGGVSGPNQTGGGNVGFNFSYTNTNTTSHSTSFTMSTSQVSKDLAIRRNTDGAEVTWTYEQGHRPKVIWDKFWHEMAAPTLTNDIDITNKVCWSVRNPIGNYKLYWYRGNDAQALFVKLNRKKSSYYKRRNEYDGVILLSAPRRFKKEWYCDLRVYGQNLKDDAIEKFLAYLREMINPVLFSNKFYLAEARNDDAMVIKYNVGLATSILKKNDELREMIDYRAGTLGIESYTLKWFTRDEAVKKKHKPFTYEGKVGKKLLLSDKK